MTGTASSTGSELGGRLLVALTTWAAVRTVIYTVTGLLVFRLAQPIRNLPTLYFQNFPEPLDVLGQWVLRLIPLAMICVGFLFITGGPAGLIFIILGLLPYVIVFGSQLYSKRRQALLDSGEAPSASEYYAERVLRGRGRGVQRGWISAEAARQPPLAPPAARAEFARLRDHQR